MLPLFFAVGVIFAPIGGLLLWASSKVQELAIDYSRCNTTAPTCQGNTGFGPIPSDAINSYFKNQTDPDQAPTWCREHTNVAGNGSLQIPTDVCRVQFYIPDRLTPPVLLYYQLTNFYQNHRRYVKSFDQDQLDGKYRDNSTIDGSDCDPLKLNDQGIAYYPCGLIANSQFNDTIFAPVALNWPGANGNYNYTMSTDNIAWDSDKELYQNIDTDTYPYGSVVPPPFWQARYPVYNETFPYPDLHNDQAFQVWMRTAGLPTFSKLSQRNDTVAMEPGRYEVRIYDCRCILSSGCDLLPVLTLLKTSQSSPTTARNPFSSPPVLSWVARIRSWALPILSLAVSAFCLVRFSQLPTLSGPGKRTSHPLASHSHKE